MDQFVYKGSHYACEILDFLGANKLHSEFCQMLTGSDDYWSVGVIFWMAILFLAGSVVSTVRPKADAGEKTSE